MKKPIYMRMIKKPDWFLDKGYDGFIDLERLEYKLMAMEQSFNVFIDKDDLSHFYELIFHYLNLNTLLSENKIYTEYFQIVKKNEDIESITTDLLDNYDKGKAFQSIQLMNTFYLRMLKKYMTLAIKYIDDVNIRINNQYIHYDDQNNYILSNITSSTTYELWKLNFRLSNKLGYNIQKVDNFIIDDTNFGEYETKMTTLNKDLPNPITAKNLVGLEVGTTINNKNIMHLISSVIMMNKLFHGRMKFNTRVIHDIESMVESRKTFPYKLNIPTV